MPKPLLPPLPCSLDPLPHETLGGFLLRLSYRLECTPNRLARRCALIERTDRIYADYLIGLPPQHADQFVRITRLSHAETAALTLDRYAQTYPPLATARIGNTTRNMRMDQNNWAISHAGRYCPQCLAGDGTPIQVQFGGAWRLAWRLPVVFACREHARLLEGVCPACDRAPNELVRGRASLVQNPQLGGLHPLQCRNADRGTRAELTACGARLDRAPATTAFADADITRILALQTRIDHHLDPANPLSESQTPTFLQDLVIISQLIKLGWPSGSEHCPSRTIADLVDQHTTPIAAALHRARSTTGRNGRTNIPELWSAPRNVAHCAALLLTAQAVLGDREPDSLRSRLQPLLHSAAKRAPRYTYELLTESSLSDDLERALVRYHRGFYAAGQQPGRLRRPQHVWRFGPDNIPPLLPAAWFDTFFSELSDLLQETGHRLSWQLRQAASLKLVELATGAAWPKCAANLDISFPSARKTFETLRKHMRTTGLWDRFAQAVNETAHYLDETPQLPNYRLRRRNLANWRMPPEDWAAACSGRRGSTLERRGADVGSIIAWAYATQNEHSRSPLLAAMHADNQDTTRLMQSVASLYNRERQRGARLRLRLRLEHYGEELGAAIDQAHIDLGDS